MTLLRRRCTFGQSRKALAHVLWIGGGTDAGKTTVAEAIVARHGLQYYNFDRNERSHIDRMVAAGDYDNRPSVYDLTPDQIWVDPEPEEMARGVIRGWSRRAEFAIDDILAMPRGPLIVAEGPGFYPEVIEPLLSSPRQAIWFVPSVEFKWQIARQRGKPSVRNQTRDPERATRNIVARDLLSADHVRKEASTRGLRLIEVDGSRSIEETIVLVEEHFAPFLRPEHDEGRGSK